MWQGQSTSIYLSIPFSLQLLDQLFTLYKINTFLFPVEGDRAQTTVIMDYLDLLACQRIT